MSEESEVNFMQIQLGQPILTFWERFEKEVANKNFRGDLETEISPAMKAVVKKIYYAAFTDAVVIFTSMAASQVPNDVLEQWIENVMKESDEVLNKKVDIAQ